MEHLVESHLGGYYISDDDPDIIETYCDTCDDYDRVILSWKKDNKLNTLIKYFSKIKIKKNEIENSLKFNDDKDELIQYLMHRYDYDRYMINILKGNNIITNEESILLLKQVSIYQKKQFEIIREVDFNKVHKKIYKRS